MLALKQGQSSLQGVFSVCLMLVGKRVSKGDEQCFLLGSRAPVELSYTFCLPVIGRE